MSAKETMDTQSIANDTTEAIGEIKAEQATQALKSYENRGIRAISKNQVIKSDDQVVIESMAARIRDLEAQLENQARESHEKSEADYHFHTGTAIRFSNFMVRHLSITDLLAFEKHVDMELARYRAFQPDTLNAYLWIFEYMLDNDAGLKKLKDNLEKADFDRISSNADKYREQLRHWEKTGEEPTVASTHP